MSHIDMSVAQPVPLTPGEHKHVARQIDVHDFERLGVWTPIRGVVAHSHECPGE